VAENGRGGEGEGETWEERKAVILTVIRGFFPYTPGMVPVGRGGCQLRRSLSLNLSLIIAFPYTNQPFCGCALLALPI